MVTDPRGPWYLSRRAMTDRPPPYSEAELAALRPQAKRLLRKRYRGMRNAVPPEALAERCRALAARVMALDAWRSARTVALFASMPDEVDTRALLDDAVARGVRVCLPVVRDDPRGLDFRLAWIDGAAAPMEMSAFGVMEPAESSPIVPPEEIDLVLVPALAVDSAGYRLGYGRGYYDAALPAMTRAERVAVAFDFQLVAELPVEPHDQRVHRVVTDRRTLELDRTEHQ